jgi:hypothetical protein
MLTFEYFLVCESATVDAATDMVSLFNVMEQFTLANLPGVIQRITAVACWRAEPGRETADYQATFRLTPPGPPPQGDPGYRDFPTNLVIDRKRVRLLQTVVNIPIPNPGDFRVDLLLNGQHQASHLITIEAGPAAGPGQNFE